jgi:anti-sigma B factor antagonist
MALNILTSKTDETCVVRVAGEIDVSNKDELDAALKSVQASGANAVEVDLSEVSYIDSSGIGTLVAAAHRATDADTRFFVSNPQHNVARVLSLLGMGKELGLTSE